jgi:transketolase
VIGKAIEIKSGERVAIFATGAVTTNALEAARALEEKGISAAVIDVHTIKPLDTACIDRYAGRKLLVSVEEHNVIGGLGGAISEYLAGLGAHPRLLRLGVKDRFSTVGDYSYLIQQSRLDATSIAEDILSELS